MGAMNGDGARVRWTLVVPLKPLARAKSRLSDTAPDAVRPRLVLAFAQDTVAAAGASPAVRDVVVVTDDPLAGRELAGLGARIVPDAPRRAPDRARDRPPDDGLNAALTHGVATVRLGRPDAAVAALNADLPALRTEELTRVLEQAARFPRAFLADAAGIGTTLLTALSGRELLPLFGNASRMRHRGSGAAEIMLPGIDSVRQDVDTGADLRTALSLGVGPHTQKAATLLPHPGHPPRSHP